MIGNAEPGRWRGIFLGTGDVFARWLPGEGRPGETPELGSEEPGESIPDSEEAWSCHDIGDHDVDDDYDDDVGSEAMVMSRAKWESPEANQGDCFRRNIGRDPRTQ